MGSNKFGDSDIEFLDCVYKLLWTSRMNAVYYQIRLLHTKRIAWWMDVVIAITASGSGIASLASKIGGDDGVISGILWPAISFVSAISAVIRPIYSPTKRIERLSYQRREYQRNYFIIKDIAFQIRQSEQILPHHRKAYNESYKRHSQLSIDKTASEDEDAPNKKCITKAEMITSKELPTENFWWPPSS